MSAYGPGTDFLRSFESKCRAGSSIRRKAFEEATAALDVDTDPPPHHAEGPLANPPVARNPSYGHSPASGTASEHCRGRVQRHCEDGTTVVKLPSVSSPSGIRLAGVSAEQRQDRIPPPCHATTFAPRIGAAAADACTSARSSLRCSTRRPPSTRPPVTVADRGGSRGHGEVRDALFRVPSIRTALQDLADIAGAACQPSPVEQVLARRKRRRRANFGVSSALLLSASTEEVPLPPMPEPRALVTREDDEHSSAAVPDLCDELETLGLSLDISHISLDSSGSWKSDSASGFRREPAGIVVRVAPFDGAAEVPQALNEDSILSSRVEQPFDWNGDRDGFAASTPARTGRREGIPLEKPREGTLRQLQADTTTYGGVGYARGDGMWPRARAKQSELGRFEGRWDDNKDVAGDSSWNQVPLREGLGKQDAAAGLSSFDFGQGVPPSPLPPPPVPLSPTVRRLRPRRVMSSGSTLLQHCQDGSCVCGAPDSKHGSLCAEILSTLGTGNDTTMDLSRTAKNEASDEKKNNNRTRDPIVGLRGDSGIHHGVVGQAPQAGGSSSPQPHLGDRVGLPETVLLQDAATSASESQAGGSSSPQPHLGGRVGPPETMLLQNTATSASEYAPPKMQSPNNTTTTPGGGCKANLTSSANAQIAHEARQYFGRLEGTHAKALHGRTHNGVDMAASSSPATRALRQASPGADRNPLQQAQPPETTAVLTLQRWLIRCAILRRDSSSEPEGGAAQGTNKPNAPKNFEQLPSVKPSSSASRHHLREAHIEDVVNVSTGASPSENTPTGQEEAISVLPEVLVGDGVPPYWEDDPIRDRSHACPQNGLALTSANSDSLGGGAVSLSSSPAFDGNGDISQGHPMKRPGSGKEKNAAQRWRCDSYKDKDNWRRTVQPPDLGGQENAVGMDQGPNTTRSSTVLFSVPSVSPPLADSVSLEQPSSPVVPRLKLDGHLQPSERENITLLYGSPASSGGRDCLSTRGNARRVSRPVIFRQALVAREVPCYSVVAFPRRVEPADVRFKAGAGSIGYGLTVQEACLRPCNGPDKGSFRNQFIGPNDHKSCHPDVVSAAAEIPVVKLASWYQQENKHSMCLARTFARQTVATDGEPMGGNPLLGAWGVGNPLLTRLPGKGYATPNRGGAPYG